MRLRSRLVWFAVVVVVVSGGLAVAPRLRGPALPPPPAYWPTQGWQRATPEKHGFDSAGFATALLTIRAKNILVHSLLIVRRGEVLVDATFYPYDGVTPHDVASVTKSITTTLIGIAVDQGRLRLDQPVVSFFSDRPIANRDARKERITVRHLLTMSSGIDCTKERDEATLREMWTAADWVQFVLDRPMRWEPGTQFVYCSPGSHLLSAILQRATGKTALEFARQNLFEPLGITNVIWPADPQGVTRGWGDIRLLAADMAKIGFLWRNQGVWDGRQVISRTWIGDSVKPHVSAGEGEHYGYGWWVHTAGEEGDFGHYRADGRGGQYIVVVPSLDVIIATTGGGFSLGAIGPLLARAIGDTVRPLPANPSRVAQLETALHTVAQAPAPVPAAPLPKMAGIISGQTYVFAPNPLQMTNMRIVFDGSATALAYLTLSDSATPRRWPVGLDGVYRMSTGAYDAPQGLRGAWADARTFVLEYAGITNNDHYTFRFRFEGEQVVVHAQETAHELGLTFTGRVRRP
ncbi:MAG TPA: serine hydrolase [bacterium]